MAGPRRYSGSRFALALLILTSVTLISLDARGYAPIGNLKKAGIVIVQPFRSLANIVFSPVGDVWESFSNGDELERENTLLRRQLDQLLSYRIANEGAVNDLEALRTQLGLQGLGGQETLVAEVTAGSVSNFDPYVLEINKGTQSGVREGMPVISTGGLIGRIENPGLRDSRVRLITDPIVNIGVLAIGTKEIGILTGNGVDQPMRVIDGIPIGAPVEVGSILVTSGLDRSPYPEGFAVGSVVEVVPDEVNLEKELLVEPTGEMDNLDFVTVVLYQPPSME
ncbi:MAG: rod shape-determining protein MreC [Acidimicrobiaceae bacterium]|nr:rod shape-determining protein MreC [Acidimicrobiaceae bacterium]